MTGLLTGPTTWPPTAHAWPPVASTASRIVPTGLGRLPSLATSEHEERSAAANTPDAATASSPADAATTTNTRNGVGRIGRDRVPERRSAPWACTGRSATLRGMRSRLLIRCALASLAALTVFVACTR